MDNEYKDLLPDKICYKCSDALLSAAQIRSLFLESDKYLKRQLIDLNLMSPMKLEQALDEKNTDEPYVEIHLEDEGEQLDDHQRYDEVPSESDQNYNPDFNAIDEYKNETKFEDDDFFAIKVPPNRRPSSKLEPGPVVTHKVCEICGKTYTRRYIAHHLKTHDSDRRKADKFQCNLN